MYQPPPQLLDAILDRSIGAPAMRVWAAVAKYGRETPGGWGFETTTTKLAKIVGVDQSGVVRGLLQLEAAKVCVRVRIGGHQGYSRIVLVDRPPVESQLTLT